MARYIYNGTFKDQNGKVVTSGNISVFLAGTATVASIYAASSGGSVVNSVTSDSTDGSFVFYVDDTDYAQGQKFKLTLSKTNYQTKSYDNIDILSFNIPSLTSAESLALTPLNGMVIYNETGSQLQTYRSGWRSIVDTDSTDILVNKTLTTPTITVPVITDLSSMNHTHSNASGGGTLGTSVVVEYILIRDEKASGTAGGAFTSGAWQTRILNTETIDTGSNASIASNQITLTAGTYRFLASAPAYACTGHKIKLYNITDTVDVFIGSSEYSEVSTSSTRSSVSGRITISGSKVFEIQHYCNTTKTVNGRGLPTTTGDVEVYTVVEFWKEI